MALYSWSFRATTSRIGRLIRRPQATGAGIVQGGLSEAGPICQQLDDPGAISWMESATRPRAAMRLDTRARDALAITAPRGLVFLDGFYRSPLPAGSIWYLGIPGYDAAAHRSLAQLVNLLREAGENRQAGGVSIYPDAKDAATIIAFLALTPGVQPERVVGQVAQAVPWDRASATTAGWHPIHITGTPGRLSGAPRAPLSSARYPRAAFGSRCQGDVCTPRAPWLPAEPDWPSRALRTRERPAITQNSATLPKGGLGFHDEPLDPAFRLRGDLRPLRPELASQERQGRRGDGLPLLRAAGASPVGAHAHGSVGGARASSH